MVPKPSRKLPPARRPPGSRELTRRERAVCAQLAKGKTCAQIGAALGISLYTVKRHLSSAYQRIGCHNAAGCVAWWMRGPIEELEAELARYRRSRVEALEAELAKARQRAGL